MVFWFISHALRDIQLFCRFLFFVTSSMNVAHLFEILRIHLNCVACVLGLYPVPVFALKRPIQWLWQAVRQAASTGLSASLVASAVRSAAVLPSCGTLPAAVSCWHAKVLLLLLLRILSLFSLVTVGFLQLASICVLCSMFSVQCSVFSVCVICVSVCVFVCHFMRFLLDAFAPPAATLCREWKFFYSNAARQRRGKQIVVNSARHALPTLSRSQRLTRTFEYFLILFQCLIWDSLCFLCCFFSFFFFWF